MAKKNLFLPGERALLGIMPSAVFASRSYIDVSLRAGRCGYSLCIKKFVYVLLIELLRAVLGKKLSQGKNRRKVLMYLTRKVHRK